MSLIEEDEGQQLKGDENSTLAPNTSNSPLSPSRQPLSARVKITDFGLARATDDASLTQSGMICGTPMYMAPEQATGQALDHGADLFSMGSVLYELATGRPPFRAQTTIAVLKRVVDDTPRPMQEIIPEIPDWFVAIVAKLHAKNPDDRFQSAKDVALLCMPSYRFAITAPLSNTHIGFRVSISVDAVREALKVTGPTQP